VDIFHFESVQKCYVHVVGMLGVVGMLARDMLGMDAFGYLCIVSKNTGGCACMLANLYHGLDMIGYVCSVEGM
jgi:hypothetical protein